MIESRCQVSSTGTYAAIKTLLLMTVFRFLTVIGTFNIQKRLCNLSTKVKGTLMQIWKSLHMC